MSILFWVAAAAMPVEVLAGRVEVTRMGLTSAEVVLRLVVANRGPVALTLHDLAYQATLDGAPFRSGQLAGPMRVEAGSQVEVPVPAEIGYAEAGGKVLGFLARGEARFRVVGSIRVEGPRTVERVTFDESGTVGVTGAGAD